MRKNILFIVLASFSIFAYANDAWVSAAGGGYTIVDHTSTTVHMKEETIRITIYDTYYSMDISFLFYNDGDAVSHDVGFPEYSYGTSETTVLKNFRCYINDVPCEYKERSEENREGNVTTSWFIRSVNFPANTYLMTRVKYDADFSKYGYWESIEYLYGTGTSWKGNIENISIEIENKSTMWILDSKFMTGVWNEETQKKENDSVVPYLIERLSESKCRILANEIKPYKKDFFMLLLSPVPNFNTLPDYADKDTWIFSTTVLAEYRLKLLSKDQLRLLRNVIFAYHGYTFANPDLKAYFTAQDWYKTDPSFSEAIFSDAERANIALIKKEEENRK